MNDNILTPIVIVGARGRMGKALICEVIASEDLVLDAVVDRSGGPGRGQDAGLLAGIHEIGLIVTDDLRPRKNTVVVDFSLPEATQMNIQRCLEAGVPLVLGTTGIDDGTRQYLREAAEKIPIVSDANFSVGITLLTRLAGFAAKVLGESWDSELFEIHHRYKRDAPSGTALRIAKAVAKASDRNLADVLQTRRSQSKTPRGQHEIGISSIRGGDSAGEHTLMFLSDGERIELSHRVTDRAIFARGALRAAHWITDRDPGLYTMSDVLEINHLLL